MARFVAFLSTLCLICILIAVIIYLSLYGPGGTRRGLDSPAVVKEIRQLNELVAVRYSIEKIVAMKEEKSPLGTESILLMVRGKVLAGIDLAELRPGDVTVSSGGLVRIRLPKPHVQEAYLDEKYTQVWDRSITWWTPWVTPDADLEHKARMQALDDIKTEALGMGIIAEAQRNAEMDIRNILRTFGKEKAIFAYGD